MSNDKMREEFEAWFAKNYPKISREETAQDCLFKMISAQAWQASREALVIELPPEPAIPEDPEEAIDDSQMDAYHSAIGMRDACAKFIEASGVKVSS